MPFTAAHPAIVLPLLRRRWLSATALIMGSMAPDFEYFFRLRTRSEISHSLPGLLLFNLPVALLLSLLFHTTVRDLVIQHLPPYFRQRALAVNYPDNWVLYLRRNWLMLSVSAVVGAFSHLFWDNFTHDQTSATSVLPVLLTTVELPVLGQIELTRIVQHLSTLVGLSLILWYVHLLPFKPSYNAERQPWLRFWISIFVAGFAFVLLNLLVRQHLQEVFKHFVVTLISGWLLALLFTGLAFKLRQQA